MARECQRFLDGGVLARAFRRRRLVEDREFQGVSTTLMQSSCFFANSA